MDSSTSKVVAKREGYLKKWTNYVLHYQRRWFIYEDGYLTYYLNPSEVGEVSRARIHLLGCKIRRTPNLGFNIIKNNSIILALRTENHKDFDDWLDTLSHAIVECDQSRDSATGFYRCLYAPNDPSLNKSKEDFLFQASIVNENCHQLYLLVKDDKLCGPNPSCNNSSTENNNHKPDILVSVKELTVKIMESLEVLVIKSELLTESAAAQKAFEKSCPTTHIDMDSNSRQSNNTIETDDVFHSENIEEDEDQTLFFDAIINDPISSKQQSIRRQNKATSLSFVAVSNRPIQHVRSVSDMINRPEISASGHRTSIPPRPPVGLNLWNLIRNMMGKDLSKVPLPVNFNEPLSMLQRLSESLEYSNLLDKASTCDNLLMQLCYVTAFTISNYSSTAFRTNKPFNPLLGETYEFDRMDDLGWRCLCEQVSHHPPMSTIYAEGRGWVLWETYSVESKFMGKYLEIRPNTLSQLVFTNTGHRYSWNKVITTVNNIVIGKLWIDNYGSFKITNHTTGDTSNIEFLPYTMFKSSNHKKVTGSVKSSNKQEEYIISGFWDKFIECAKYIDSPDNTQRLSRREILWTANRLPLNSEKMYNFSEFACSLNEMDNLVAPTDSRRRPDQIAMEKGDFPTANELKVQLEDAQRARRKRILQHAIAEGRADSSTTIEDLHQPIWFEIDTDVDQTNGKRYKYKGGYWEAKLKQNFSMCPEIFKI